MSGYLRVEDRLYDPITKQWVGFVGLDGAENIINPGNSLKSLFAGSSYFGSIIDSLEGMVGNRFGNAPWIAPDAWSAQTYTRNTYVTNGGNVYYTCTGGASTVGPSGIAFQTLDTTVRWEYVCPAITAPSVAPILSVSSTPSTLTRFYRNAACTFSSGATDVISNDAWYTLMGLTSAALSSSGIGSFVSQRGGIAFETDAPAVCLAVQASQSMLSVTEDGIERWINLGRIPTDSGAAVRYATVTFPVRKQRTWKLWSVQTNTTDGIIKGVYVDRLSIVQAPYQVQQTPLVMVQTDSFGVGGASYYSGPDPISMPRNWFGRLGVDRVFTDPQGGTGFTAGGTLAYTASARTSLVSTVNPDVLVLFGSVNDSGATLSTMTTAVSAVVDAARAVMGASKPIIITGVMGKNAAYGEGTIESNLRQAIAAKGDPNVFFIPVQGASQPWVYAGNNASSPDGTGNSDWIISPDNLHPLQIGKDYLCRLLAEATMRLAVANR